MQKSLLTYLTPFHAKVPGEIMETREYLTIMKTVFRKPIANINVETHKTIPQKIGTRQGCPFFLYLFNIVLVVLARTIIQLEGKQSKYLYLHMIWHYVILKTLLRNLYSW